MCEQVAQGHFMACNWLHGIGCQIGVIQIVKNPSDLKNHKWANWPSKILWSETCHNAYAIRFYSLRL